VGENRSFNNPLLFTDLWIRKSWEPLLYQRSYCISQLADSDSVVQYWEVPVSVASRPWRVLLLWLPLSTVAFSNCIFPTECIHELGVILRSNSDYFLEQHLPIFVCVEEGTEFLNVIWCTSCFTGLIRSFVSYCILHSVYNTSLWDKKGGAVAFNCRAKPRKCSPD
jgi:hypothetical protein